MSERISRIFEQGALRKLARGATLFRTGDPVRRAYLVHRGEVELVRHSLQGARLVLHRAAPGAVVAEASVYASAYHCDGVATEEAELASLPVAAFLAALSGDSVTGQDWARQLSHGLQAARMQAEIRSLKTVAERLDAWMAGARELPPKGHWQGLAQELGVSREALYRELARRR